MSTMGVSDTDMSQLQAVLVDTIQKLLIEEAVAADHELQLRRKLLARQDLKFRPPLANLANPDFNPNTSPKPGGTR